MTKLIKTGTEVAVADIAAKLETEIAAPGKTIEELAPRTWEFRWECPNCGEVLTNGGRNQHTIGLADGTLAPIYSCLRKSAREDFLTNEEFKSFAENIPTDYAQVLDPPMVEVRPGQFEENFKNDRAVDYQQGVAYMEYAAAVGVTVDNEKVDALEATLEPRREWRQEQREKLDLVGKDGRTLVRTLIESEVIGVASPVDEKQLPAVTRNLDFDNELVADPALSVDYEQLELRTRARQAMKAANFGMPGGAGSVDIPPGEYEINGPIIFSDGAMRCSTCGDAIFEDGSQHIQTKANGKMKIVCPNAERKK